MVNMVNTEGLTDTASVSAKALVQQTQGVLTQTHSMPQHGVAVVMQAAAHGDDVSSMHHGQHDDGQQTACGQVASWMLPTHPIPSLMVVQSAVTSLQDLGYLTTTAAAAVPSSSGGAGTAHDKGAHGKTVTHGNNPTTPMPSRPHKSPRGGAGGRGEGPSSPPAGLSPQHSKFNVSVQSSTNLLAMAVPTQGTHDNNNNNSSSGGSSPQQHPPGNAPPLRNNKGSHQLHGSQHDGQRDGGTSSTPAIGGLSVPAATMLSPGSMLLSNWGVMERHVELLLGSVWWGG